MNKSELITAIAESTNVSKSDTTKVVNEVFNQISGALAAKDQVQIVGFGSFVTVDKPEREGRNPSTGEKIKLAACTQPKFKPGKALKDRVND